ncbi:hypothetical protein SAMN05192588_0680 [Nonlabens sp. Hel1_33_55]|nr:hypothetical protein SAMN05192588_0680 [Nonlabens sp. Hel1_33_55]
MHQVQLETNQEAEEETIHPEQVQVKQDTLVQKERSKFFKWSQF